MNTPNIQNDPAYAAMTVDILNNILSRADNLGKLGQYLAQEIQELIGVSCVLFIEYTENPAGLESYVVSVNPSRRQSWSESPQACNLYRMLYPLAKPQSWSSEDNSQAAQILKEEGYGLSAAIPLYIGDTQVGSMLLLGLRDGVHLESQIHLFDTLSTLIALVIRNASLYRKQEEIIAQRTSDLEAKNKALIESEKQIQSLLSESEKSRQAVLSILEDEKQTRESLRHEKDLVSRMMETSPIGITALNRDGQIVFANTCAETIFGLNRDEVSKRRYNTPDWQITDYDGNPLPNEKLPFQMVQATGGPVYNIQHAIQRPDGRRVFLSVNAAPLFSATHKYEGMIAAIEDVTERKTTENALKESEARFRTLFNAMSEGVALHELVTDKEGKAIDYRIIDVNPAYVVHTGLNVAEARNQLASKLYNTGNPPYLDLFAHVAQTGAPMYFETFFTPMQKYFDISIFCPKPGWFATVFNDITLRRQTQQELRASEEKFMKAFRGSPVTMAISTIEEGRIIEVNDTFLEVMGFQKEEVIDKTSLELQIYTEPGQREKFVRDVKSKGYVRNEECTLRDRNGQLHYGLLSIDTIDIQNTSYLLTIMNDITERKKAEELQQMHQANMAHLLRLGELGEMASGLAHEINQPLCAIENYAQACLRLMEIKPDMARLAGAIKDIRDQAERAGKIVHRVKGLVRKKPPQFEFVQIKEIIQEAVDLVSTEAKKREMQILVNIPEDIAPVYADLILIEQVVINLVRNGLEAMDSPQLLKKELTIEVESGSNQMIKVSVSDTGCGIPEANMKKIFESFFSTKSDGLGVGLPLSRAIIESHFGQLWATTNPGGGTIFHFTLPTRSPDNEK